mmetsp:Transcript_51983/g.103453  ORF Transcript_51983/g.103453 Transcript_51983/m.103453 type:complete len:158 (-) Transcript_51983:103-576(-)
MVLEKKAAALRERAARRAQVGEETKLLEDKELEVYDKKCNQPLAARLGAIISLRNIRLNDVVTKWDKNGNGELSKSEFRKELIELGIEAPRHEVSDLFDELDTVKDGLLQLDEMKAMLKTLVTVAKETEQAIKAADATLAQTRRKVKKDQAALATNK